MIDEQIKHGPRDLIPFYQDDTLEDLQRGGFRLLQKRQGFRFGLDSVLLAAYAASFYSAPGKRKISVADLGAGCGAVSLLLAARLPGALITGVELDPISCATLQRNIDLNGLPERMTAIAGDISQLADGRWRDSRLAAGTFDLVVSNPPYQRLKASLDGPNDCRRQARAETTLDLGDLLRAAKRLLRPGGRLVMVHQVRRLPEIFGLMRDCGLEPKTMRMIQSLPDRAPITVLISAVRQGRTGGFAAGPPLLVCTRPGVWSDETAALYGLEPPLTSYELQQGLQTIDEDQEQAKGAMRDE